MGLSTILKTLRKIFVLYEKAIRAVLGMLYLNLS